MSITSIPAKILLCPNSWPVYRCITRLSGKLAKGQIIAHFRQPQFFRSASQTIHSIGSNLKKDLHISALLCTAVPPRSSKRGQIMNQFSFSFSRTVKSTPHSNPKKKPAPHTMTVYSPRLSPANSFASSLHNHTPQEITF